MKKLILVSTLVLSACAEMGTPPATDPKITASIEAACTQSGLFKKVNSAVGSGVNLATGLPASLITSITNAGVDKVCADPARYASDITTAKWVAQNLIDLVRNR